MDDSKENDLQGSFAVPYLAFLETIPQLRPRLHRYCARMTGSVLDGEDVVQEALFEAYRKLDTFDTSRPMAPWIFRIAHNRCIDLLRRRGVRQEAEAAAFAPDSVPPVEPAALGIGRAVEHLVLTLPPLERACVLLKDVFDDSLEEIAELVSSTVGGVKAALHRGRSKLASLPGPSRSSRSADPELARLQRLYMERFNRRDWDGVRELIHADARLRVADRFAGRVITSPYFGNYERWSIPWRFTGGDLDGESVILRLERHDGRWTKGAVIRLEWARQHVVCIADYGHCPWVLNAASSVVTEELPPE
jgi:RNA polymerase sigma-70 factor (ECF subfamily)